MQRLLLIMAITTAALVGTAMSAAAANSPAQIVNCSTATACYSPDPIRISTGTTITWTNGTSLAHTATADGGAWDTGAIATGAASSPITFNTPGTFAYHCRFHADMHGSVIVTAAVSTTPSATIAATTRATPAPSTRRLAQSGGAPIIPAAVGTASLLLGLLLLRRGRQRPA